MRRSWVWRLAGFVALLLAGCLSQTAAGPPDQAVDAAQAPTLSPEVAGPLRQFCESVFQAIAGLEFRCTGRPLALFSKQFDVDYECVALADAVARKRLVWEPGAAAACPNELRAARCSDLRRRGTFGEQWQLVTPACGQALRGLVQAEQRCGFVHYAFEECADADTVCSATSACITGSCICQGSLREAPGPASAVLLLRHRVRGRALLQRQSALRRPRQGRARPAGGAAMCPAPPAWCAPGGPITRSAVACPSGLTPRPARTTPSAPRTTACSALAAAHRGSAPPSARPARLAGPRSAIVARMSVAEMVSVRSRPSLAKPAVRPAAKRC